MMSGYIDSLFSLRGRVALVTGGGSGVGRQIALALFRAGASIVVVGRREAKIEETAQAAVRNPAADNQAAALAADLALEKEIDRVVVAAARFFGPLDILVNAAGINLRKPAAQITADDWRRTLDLNLRAPFFLARGIVAATGGMRDKRAGAIVNVGSLQSRRAGLGDAAYGASKGGVLQLTRGMAKEWGGCGVTANAILPGFFPTDMTRSVWGDSDLTTRLAQSTLLGRNGELADLEGAAVFLASPAARYITGCALPVDGGFLAK